MQYALVAEFDSSTTCARAIHALKQRSVGPIEVYMPYPDKEIHEALALRPSPLPRVVFAAGALGAILSYAVLWYTNVYDYPLNVGGRPTHAVPAFIPITFEATVLFAGCAAFIGSLVLGGLPRLHHPADEVVDFGQVCVDRFALVLRAAESASERQPLQTELQKLGALSVTEFGASARSSTTETVPKRTR